MPHIWCLFLLLVITYTYVILQVWFLPRFEGKKALRKPWTGAVWRTNWVFTIQGGHISIYIAALFKIHTQRIHFIHWIVLIMGFIVLSSSLSSIRMLNARKCAQKPTKKEPGRIWPNWIFLRWECSLITSTTGWYLISGFTVKWVERCLSYLC